jgi:tetratricopeptide (TPR) repeat protein
MIFAMLVVNAVLIAACLSQPLSQEARDRLVREARESARGGTYGEAIKKLESLYASSPEDAVIVRALFDILVAAKNYPRAEQVIVRYLEGRPDDVRGMADLAMLHFRTGRADSGRQLLTKIVGVAPGEIWPYQLCFQALLEVGMDEEALEMASEARAALGDSVLFAVDAARIHSDAARYGAATREYLRAGTDKHMGADVVADYILRLASSGDARGPVIEALRRARGVPSFAGDVARVLWRVYLLDGECDRALAELEVVSGNDRDMAGLFTDFAGQARQKMCYEECSRAYDIAVALMGSDPQVPVLLLKKAECELDGGQPEDALATFDVVAGKYKGTLWSIRADLAAADTYRDMGGLYEAVMRFDRVIASAGGGKERHQAILAKGDCLVRMGSLDEAFKVYDMVGTDWEDDYAQEAFFNLAEISLYRLDFDKALAYYNVTLRQYPAETRANDSIDRLLLLKSSKRGEAYQPDLDDFARASLLRRQGEFEEALGILGRLAGGPGVGPMKVESLRSMSEIHLGLGTLDQAMAIYKTLGESLETYFSSSALEAVGDIYVSMDKREEAVETYETVILNFPNSVSAGEARRKIESLRQERSDDL